MLYPSSDLLRKEWFYDAEKGSDFEDSSYNNKGGRDPRAYGATETFRKTFLKDPKGHTPEFLNSIVRKFKIFGPFATWEEFVEKVEIDLTTYNYFWRHLGVDLAAILSAARKRIYLKEMDIVSSRYVHIKFEDLQRQGKVALAGTDSLIVSVLSDGFITTANDNYLGVIRKFEESLDNHKTAFTYDRKAIHSTCDSYYFYHSWQGLIGALEFLPLNEEGAEFVTQQSNFFKRIDHSMICSKDDIENVSAFYLNIVSNTKYIETIPRLGVHLYRIAQFVLGKYHHDTVIYMTDDTFEKFKIIKLYGMNRFPFSAPLGMLGHAYKLENGAMSRVIKWRSYHLYALKAFYFAQINSMA